MAVPTMIPDLIMITKGNLQEAGIGREIRIGTGSGIMIEIEVVNVITGIGVIEGSGEEVEMTMTII